MTRQTTTGSDIQRHIYWHETEAVVPGPALTTDISCNVCFIGGGYTSLWTSIFLKNADPSIDIHILEAEYAGAGGSGHNDGFVTPTIGHSLSTVVSQFGVEASKEAYVLLGRSILELLRFCENHGINADIEPNGFYLIATNDGQMRRLQHDVELASQFGGRMSLRLLDRQEMLTRVPSPLVQAGIAGGGALINPFRLVRGLARVAAQKGVHIHEQTPAGNVSTTDSVQVVATPRARVTADHVVFATNAYQGSFPQFRNHIVAVWSYALVSDPLTNEQLERSQWASRQGFVEAKNFIVFGRVTADNRILFGGGPAPHFYGRTMDTSAHMRNDRVEVFLRGQAKRLLPHLHDLRWSHFYGGPIAITRRLIPQVGTLRPGWHFAHGYCGNGIASTHLAGKALSDLVLGRSTKYTNLFFVEAEQPRIPPRPFAYVGTKAATLFLRAQDRYPHMVHWPRL